VLAANSSEFSYFLDAIDLMADFPADKKAFSIDAVDPLYKSAFRGPSRLVQVLVKCQALLGAPRTSDILIAALNFIDSYSTSFSFSLSFTSGGY
jgi:hypothetical protein